MFRDYAIKSNLSLTLYVKDLVLPAKDLLSSDCLKYADDERSVEGKEDPRYQ